MANSLLLTPVNGGMHKLTARRDAKHSADYGLLVFSSAGASQGPLGPQSPEGRNSEEAQLFWRILEETILTNNSL